MHQEYNHHFAEIDPEEDLELIDVHFKPDHSDVVFDKT